MKKILIFDTAVASENAGDLIIMAAVNKELRSLFHNEMFFYSQTHDKISKQTHKLNQQADYSFVGGTNLLSSDMKMKCNQWNISIIDLFFLKNIILMGVGCGGYGTIANYYTPYLFNKILHKNILHSVRDSYTEGKFRAMGFDNVINTGCPTMWDLTPEHCLGIPKQKADSVVLTLTDYRRDAIKDQILIDILVKNYKNIYFWVQGSCDFDYFQTFNNTSGIQILGGNLWSYDALLKDKKTPLDFIGTRLHAGIRALQNQRRSIIIGVDNRAIEKAKDFNLTVLLRQDIAQLATLLNNELTTDLSLNWDNIALWKSQFNNIEGANNG